MTHFFHPSSSTNGGSSSHHRIIHHPHHISQYSYNGPTSCTYCCLEASLYFLHGLIDSNMSHTDLHRVMEMVLSQGVMMDLSKDGYRAADEVLQRVPRFKHQLKLNSIAHFKLSDELCFTKLVQSIKKKCLKKNMTKMAVCLTKPPVSIAVFYDSDNVQFPFCVFDSHTSSAGGASFRFCTENDLKLHLRQRLKLMDLSVFGGNVHTFQQYSMFEASFLTLGELKQLMDPRAFSDYETNQNPLARNLGSSMTASALDYSLNASMLPGAMAQQQLQQVQLPQAVQQAHTSSNPAPQSPPVVQQTEKVADNSTASPVHSKDAMDFISIIRTLVSERKARNATIQELKEQNAQLEERFTMQLKEKNEIIQQLERDNETLIEENESKLKESEEFNNQLVEVVQAKDDRIRELTELMLVKDDRIQTLSEQLDSMATLLPRMEAQEKEMREMSRKYFALLDEFRLLVNGREESTQ